MIRPFIWPSRSVQAVEFFQYFEQGGHCVCECADVRALVVAVYARVVFAAHCSGCETVRGHSDVAKVVGVGKAPRGGSIAPNQLNLTECPLSDLAENPASSSYDRV